MCGKVDASSENITLKLKIVLDSHEQEKAPILIGA
jgi:hypothetical protein